MKEDNYTRGNNIKKSKEKRNRKQNSLCIWDEAYTKSDAKEIGFCAECKLRCDNKKG